MHLVFSLRTVYVVLQSLVAQPFGFLSFSAITNEVATSAAQFKLASSLAAHLKIREQRCLAKYSKRVGAYQCSGWLRFDRLQVLTAKTQRLLDAVPTALRPRAPLALETCPPTLFMFYLYLPETAIRSRGRRTTPTWPSNMAEL